MEIVGGKAYIIVGATGHGKSTFVKDMVSAVPDSRLYVYDVNREYFPDEEKELEDIGDFSQRLLPLKESVFIFEEATIFFSNRGSDKNIRNILVRKRHNRNNVFLIFHSIRSIPFYIYDLCNYVIVFHTNDEADLVADKHPLLLDAYRKVHNIKYEYEIVKLS